jgi:Major Facilitator Superfamily
MLLIGGKNLIPLVSAAIIQSIGWPWVFGIVAIIVAVMFVLTYLFVPETAWDRTPHHEPSSRGESRAESRSSRAAAGTVGAGERVRKDTDSSADEKSVSNGDSNGTTLTLPQSPARVRFAGDHLTPSSPLARSHSESPTPVRPPLPRPNSHTSSRRTPSLRRLERLETEFEIPTRDIEPVISRTSIRSPVASIHEPEPEVVEEVLEYRFRRKSYKELLVVYQGRISTGKWWKAALRPFVLYAYPAITFVRIPLPLVCSGLTSRRRCCIP